MNVRYEHKKAMTFIGFSTSIRPDEGYEKCPKFWENEYSRRFAKLWQTMTPETPIEKAVIENQIGMFAICDDKDGSFDYWIAGLYTGGEVPEGLKLFTFPESDWAMFSAKGALPKSLQDLNTRVWEEWYPNQKQNYKGNGNAMLEVYTAGDMQSPDYECGIWVPVCKAEKSDDGQTAEIVSSMTVTGIL